MSGSMYLGAAYFDGDPGELLPAYQRMLDKFGLETLDVHLCITRDGGLTVFDACPTKQIYEEFTTERDVPGRDRRGRAARTAGQRSRRHPGRARPAGDPPVSEELALLDATAQAELVRTGQVSAAELVTAAIERIEALNPVLNAVVTPVFDRAAEAARAGPAGPFAGVPYLVKDLAVEMEGVRFTEGSVFLAGHVSAFDSELVLRLRRAGLVILGKTNTPEFGMAPACEPVLFGPTRNPWDTRRSTSGSSGGSAAAVASGMVPFAHGNDLGGSLRYPASACGLFALKPTRARNPFGPEYGDVAARRGGRARADPFGPGQRRAARRHVRARPGRPVLGAAAGPPVPAPRWAPIPGGCGSATPCGRPTATSAIRTASRPPSTPPGCAPRSATRSPRRTGRASRPRSARPSAR